MTAAPEWTEWWEATKRPVLLVQTCDECGHRQHYPRALCTACGSDRLAWLEASGAATIYSFTVSHRSPEPDRWQPPYVIAIVQLAEGPRMLTHIATDRPDELRCDQTVRLAWAARDDGTHLPIFRPEEQAS